MARPDDGSILRRTALAAAAAGTLAASAAWALAPAVHGLSTGDPRLAASANALRVAQAALHVSPASAARTRATTTAVTRVAATRQSPTSDDSED